MRSAVVVCIAFAAVAGLVSGSNDCTPEDNTVQQVLFAQLQKQLKTSNAEYISLPDFSQSLFGLVGVEWKGAKAGNFSSLSLTQVPSATSSSELCKTVNGGTVERKLSINLGFENLEASFAEFVISTPFFKIGGQNTGIGLSGDSLLVTVDTVTTNTTCTAKLSAFTFTSWGNLQLTLGSGLVNFFLEKIFNNYANTMVLNLLQEFGVAGIVNNAVTSYAGQIIDASGQQATVCQLVNLVG